jgi:AcrR family transcriptional regulator
MYSEMVPKLWTETVEAHRHEVRLAIMESTARLVAEQGVRSVTMSEIAEKTGIGRATLYKYFPDVDAILLAWHQLHISAHLQHLAEIRDRTEAPGERLERVLEAFADHVHESRSHRESELAGMLHRGEHMETALQELTGFMTALIQDAAGAGQVRTDISADELAEYCIHALAAASSLKSSAAVRRLVAVTLRGLRADSPTK